MITVQLTIRGGAHVAYVEMPAFKMLPEVLIWGTRIFGQKGPNDQGQPIYEEVFAYHVPIYEHRETRPEHDPARQAGS